SARPSVIGSTLRINGIDFTVVGIAPKDFTGVDPYFRPNFYVPLQMWGRITGAAKNPLEDRNKHAFSVMGRMKPGITPDKAQAELTTIWKGLEPEQSLSDRLRAPRVRTTFQARVQDDPEDAALISLLTVLVAVVLVIACANVANLLVGRARARNHEIAI